MSVIVLASKRHLHPIVSRCAKYEHYRSSNEQLVHVMSRKTVASAVVRANAVVFL